MLVEHILATKGTEVATVAPGEALSEAVAELHRRRIGALVVTEGGDRIVGMLSERDIVRALAEHGPAALERTVADVMTADVHACDPSATCAELMAVMTERRIRHIPVVAGGRLAGLVSIGDVVKRRVDELDLEARTLHEYVTAGR